MKKEFWIGRIFPKKNRDGEISGLAPGVDRFMNAPFGNIRRRRGGNPTLHPEIGSAK